MMCLVATLIFVVILIKCARNLTGQHLTNCKKIMAIIWNAYEKVNSEHWKV